jgi:hypothetical protein
VEPLHSDSLLVERIFVFILHKQGSGVLALHKPGFLNDPAGFEQVLSD